MKKENDSKVKLNKLSYSLISFHIGIATLSDIAVQYYLKDTLKLQPGSYSRILSITNIPWMLKPLFGLLSDLLPIFGYRRKLYLLLCGILNIVCWLIMAFYVNNLLAATFVLFMVNLALSFSSVIGEAVVVETSKYDNTDEQEANNNAKDNISSFFILKNIGVLGSSYLKGFLVDVISLKNIFIIASLTPLLVVISGFILREDTVKKNDPRDIENTTESNQRVLYKEFFKFLFQKQILLPLMFIVLLMSTPNYDDPMFYFLTEKLKFKGSILGLMSFTSALTAIIAILIYQRYLKNISFKVLLAVGNCLYALFGLSALLLVTRVNKELGIPDALIAIFSSSACNMISEFILMPILALAAILCPRDLEATVYSVFMSAINFGWIISYVASSFITEHLAITKTNFTNLPKMIFISNCACLLPLFILIFIDGKYFSPDSKDKKPISRKISIDNKPSTGDESEKAQLLKNEEIVY
jgi:Na+/melibiose symporter-like transporter